MLISFRLAQFASTNLAYCGYTMGRRDRVRDVIAFVEAVCGLWPAGGGDHKAGQNFSVGISRGAKNNMWRDKTTCKKFFLSELFIVMLQ